MKGHRRLLSLLAGLAVVLAACGPEPSIATPAPVSATPTPAPATPTPVLETPTPAPTATPTTGGDPLAQAAWQFVQPVVDNNGKIDHYALYLGFAGGPATALITTFSVPDVRLHGELAMVWGKFTARTEIALRIFRIADGARVYEDALARRELPREAIIDGRAALLYYDAVTADEGLELHRIDLKTGTDTTLLAFGRPFGAEWADQDHAHSTTVDLNRPGFVHYVICTNGINKSDCAFYLAGPTETAARKTVAVTGNTFAMCHVLGADEKYAFTFETTSKCPKEPKGNGAMRVTDMTTGESHAILVVAGKPSSLTRPILVATDAGPRLVHVVTPKGSKARALASYDPVQNKSDIIPFTIDRGPGATPATALLLMPLIESDTYGYVLVAPADSRGFKPVSPALWGPDSPKPALVDVLTGESKPTTVWLPGDIGL